LEMQGSETHWTTNPGANHVVNALADTGGERAEGSRAGLHTLAGMLALQPAPLHVLSFIPVFSPLLLFQGSCCIYAVWFL
jgi:hypothetical protein